MSIINFSIDYKTNFGQDVYITGSDESLGNFDESCALKLTYKENKWHGQVEINKSQELEYYYLIKEYDVVTRKEWGKPRKLSIIKSRDFEIADFWKDKPFHSYLYSSVFTESIFVHQIKTRPVRYFKESILLSVICPYVNRNQTVIISGENDALGNWNPHKSPTLEFIGNAEWRILLNVEDWPKNTEYKFLIAEKTNPAIYRWEDGENRMLIKTESNSQNVIRVEKGLHFRHNSFTYKGTGTSIPVFSLRTKNSFGIGDFNDLKLLIDWVKNTNQQIIQLLPVNDTTAKKTWQDSYPYNAISSFALHPIYLGLSDFILQDKKKMKAFTKEANNLNKLSEIDYEKVFDLKMRFIEVLYEQTKTAVFSSDAYNKFYDENRHWLFPYALYSYLRDQYETDNFANWGEYAVYNEEKILTNIERDQTALHRIGFYTFIQYLLHGQLQSARIYAHENGIVLKGDIPIGINRNSVDAWTHPHLFNMDTQTGAPPDDFSVTGQNWGFPTYNWNTMEKENYAWWKNRFTHMAKYFDAYRIDHILGFFRIWEIPLHSVQGLLGHFSPALPYWPEELHQAGIPFDANRMTTPYIHDDCLHELFGEYKNEVITTYLDILENGLYKLKEPYAAQNKIKQIFDGAQDEKSIIIRDGLYALCNEVLFVYDKRQPTLLHPRITAQSTFSYKHLDENIKVAFDNLYNEFYYHRHNYFWREEAMKKLPPLIASTSMLVCGEDLGMVPHSVPSVMKELNILSLEIERMPKASHDQFTHLNAVPYLSVFTTSTHDMSPLRLWWQENRSITQQYFNDVLKMNGEAPKQCTPDLCRDIIQRHLVSHAMWVILPLQDWMSVSNMTSHIDPETERINIPSNPHHYWRYRMHINLEDLLQHDSFNEKVRNLSNRN